MSFELGKNRRVRFRVRRVSVGIYMYIYVERDFYGDSDV